MTRPERPESGGEAGDAGLSRIAQPVAPVGVIGMVHLQPLPASPRWGGSLEHVIERAVQDARSLVAGGVDAVLVENYGDAPFHADRVEPVTVAAMTRVVTAVAQAVDGPLGLNVLRNDARSALAVAAVTGAAFVRVNIHTGGMHTDQGWIEGRAAESLRLRRQLAPGVAILADVFVKHATPPAGLELGDAARDAWHRGLADALVVTGSATGHPADPARVRTVRDAVPGAVVLVGSGVTHETVASVLATADGVIVGSAFEAGGVAGARVEVERVRRLVEAARTGAGR